MVALCRIRFFFVRFGIIIARLKRYPETWWGYLEKYFASLSHVAGVISGSIHNVSRKMGMAFQSTQHSACTMIEYLLQNQVLVQEINRLLMLFHAFPTEA